MIYVSWCFGIERLTHLNNSYSIINKNVWISQINHTYANVTYVTLLWRKLSVCSCCRLSQNVYTIQLCRSFSFSLLIYSLLVLIYQEALCCVRFNYKVKETNAWNTVQSMLFYVSLSFRHIFLSVLAFIAVYCRFKFHNRINTIIETNTDLDNVQEYAQWWYFIVPVVWYAIDYAKKGQNMCNKMPQSKLNTISCIKYVL